MIAPPPPKQRPHAIERTNGAHMRATTLLSSFGYAFAGVWHLLSTQRNAKIHVVLGLAATALGLLLGIDRYEWLALIVTITVVLAAEGVNTALEAVVDMTAPEYHPLAKIAKDVGAGAVLLAAIGSVVVGAVVFLPHLWPLLSSLLGWN